MRFADPTFEGTQLPSGSHLNGPSYSQMLVEQPTQIIQAMTKFGMMEIQGTLKGVAEGGNVEGAGGDDATAEEQDEKQNKSCLLM